MFAAPGPWRGLLASPPDPPAQETPTPAVTEDPAEIWARIQDALRQAVPASTYDIWLAPLRAEVRGHEVTVEAPPKTHRWVAERFGRALEAGATAVLGPGARVALRPAGAPSADTEPRRAAGRADDDTDELNPKYTFDQFVIGPANRFAHAAALAVAELPGQAYNPLFVYGPPGVGKTHLLHSVGNYVRAYGAGLTVRYTTVETFTSHFVRALQHGGIERFKELHRRVDVLLVDDVQFLGSKARTEEELFHTVNALQEAGSQLVLTSDRVPRDLDGVHDRLRERFEAGLVTDIRPPDRATRLTVLRKRVAHDDVALDGEEVLDLIADRITTNVRALEGALIRVVAFASLTGRRLDAALAAEVLDDLYSSAASRGSRAGTGTGTPGVALTPEHIQDVTARALGLQRDDLLSSGRTAAVTWARQLAMYLVREHTDASLPAIGRSFGGRNHTTVMHACRRVAARLAADPEAYAAARRVTAELGVRAGRRPAEPDRPG
jgi:chromosomal replication initiator protein